MVEDEGNDEVVFEEFTESASPDFPTLAPPDEITGPRVQIVLQKQGVRTLPSPMIDRRKVGRTKLI